MHKNAGFSLVFLLLASIMLFAVPVEANPNGPKTPNMLIDVFFNPNKANREMEKCPVDVNDWPLTKFWIDRWNENPDIITMKSYTAFDMFQFDLNNQKWPTGAGNETFYNPANPRAVAAYHFRRALAYLTDKNKIISDILGGYGYRMDTCLPKPLADVYLANASWADMYYGRIPWVNDIQRFNYNKTSAVLELIAGGFADWDNDGVVEWKNPNNGIVEELPELQFFISVEDSNRRAAGNMLSTEMNNLPRHNGISFVAGQMRINHKCRVVDCETCKLYVMKLYDYHIYTGYWDLNPIPDYLCDLWDSESWLTTGAVGIEGSRNYPGFCNYEYDKYAKQVKYNNGINLTICIQKACQVFADQVGIIPLWSSAAVKAFKTGWDGVVNNFGYGLDNYYTFLNMKHTNDNTINWGFSNQIQALNVIYSRWPWDWKVLDLIYDSMMGRNPFNQALDQYFLCDDYVVTTWTNGTATMTRLYFHIPGTAKWQDYATGTPYFVTTADVIFSLNFTKTCGPRVAWNWPSVKDMNDTRVAVGSIPGKVNDGKWVNVTENVLSMFALDWIALLPLIPRHIWEAKFPDWKTWTPAVSQSAAVKAWRPWQEPNADVPTMTKAVGSGPWIFKEWKNPRSLVASKEYVKLVANTQFYLTQTQVEQRIAVMFNAVGNVNYVGAVNTYPYYDEVINDLDVAYVMRAFGQSGANQGTGWGQMNVDADFNKDGKVDATDYAIVHKYYGKCVDGGLPPG